MSRARLVALPLGAQPGRGSAKAGTKVGTRTPARAPSRAGLWGPGPRRPPGPPRMGASCPPLYARPLHPSLAGRLGTVPSDAVSAPQLSAPAPPTGPPWAVPAKQATRSGPGGCSGTKARAKLGAAGPEVGESTQLPWLPAVSSAGSFMELPLLALSLSPGTSPAPHSRNLPRKNHAKSVPFISRNGA